MKISQIDKLKRNVLEIARSSFVPSVFSLFIVFAPVLTAAQTRIDTLGTHLIELDRATVVDVEARYHQRELVNQDTGKRHTIVTEGDADLAKTWISGGAGHLSPKSLGIGLLDNPGCVSKQRAELQILNTRMDEEFFYSFSVFLHPQSKPLTKPTVFTQVWQNHYARDGHAKFPAFALAFVDRDYRFEVHTSNGEMPSPGNGRTIYRSPNGLQKGIWHRFIVRFKPSESRSGAVGVWFNGNPIVSQTHQRNFGYAVTSQHPVVLNSFITRIGAYRGRLPCWRKGYENVSLGNLFMFFDYVKTGRKMSDVMD